MSKIGTEFLALTNDDMGTPQYPEMAEQLPAERARGMVDRGIEADPAYQLGHLQYMVTSDANMLAAFDFSQVDEAARNEVLSDIDTTIATLTKVAEKLGK